MGAPQPDGVAGATPPRSILQKAQIIAHVTKLLLNRLHFAFSRPSLGRDDLAVRVGSGKFLFDLLEAVLQTLVGLLHGLMAFFDKISLLLSQPPIQAFAVLLQGTGLITDLLVLTTRIFRIEG